MSINIFDLPYLNDLVNFAEAMQYAFYEEPNSDYDKQNKRYWIGQIFEKTKIEVAKQIKETKSTHADELASSPILLGLLDTYVDACETSDTQQLKDLYTRYQNLQKDCPFTKNKQAYFDAGCALTVNFNDETSICVMYPIHLFTAYQANGGNDDDHRGGFLYPNHKLSDEEVLKLHKTNPDLFVTDRVKKVYEDILDAQQELE